MSVFVKYLKIRKMKNSIKTYVEAKTMRVFLAVTFRGKRFYASTGMATTEKFSGMAFPRTVPNYIAKTGRLVKLITEVEAYMLRNPEESFEKMKASVKRIINGEEAKPEGGILSYIEEFAKTKAKEGTRLILERTMKRVETFDPHATFDTIDRAWLERYEAHELIKGRKINGIAIDLRNIRTVFNWAIDNEITTKYPFRKFSIKTERQQYLYLNAKEMKEIRDITLEPFMERYRDLFMLGFYLIGINLSDLLELPSDCIKHGRLQYRRNKTGRLYDIKVEPEAMEIINKYKGKGHLLDILDDGQVKETSFRRTLGNYLKRIGPVRMEKNSRGALIKKVITPLHEDMIWYTARRSWATIAAELDIPKETIGKALGHSEWDSTTTDRYIQFDNKKIDEANRKVIDALGDKLAG